MQETIGQVIRRLRKERDITQEELAEALGITAQAVSKWENDVGIPDVSQFVPIANLFDISIDTLFGRSDKSTDAQVKELLDSLDARELSAMQEFEELSDALTKYPNHPDLLYRIVHTATLLMMENDGTERSHILTKSLKAADSYILRCKEPEGIIRMKMEKIDLLTYSGCFAEAELLAQEFDIPFITRHVIFARLNRMKNNFTEEVRHRQENIALALIFLMSEISYLGIAYQNNGQIAEALDVHSINLKLPYLIHGDAPYHAPLHNSYLLSGFDAAYCLVQLERYDEAVNLLEEIFEYAAVQCKCCCNCEPLVSPLLRDIDMEGYHGELLEEDYLWKIEAEEFAPLHDDPRFQALKEKFEALRKRS